MNLNTGIISQIPEETALSKEQIPLTQEEAAVLDQFPFEERVKELGVIRMIERLKVPRMEHLRVRIFFKAGYDFAMALHKFTPIEKTDTPPGDPKKIAVECLEKNFVEKKS